MTEDPLIVIAGCVVPDGANDVVDRDSEYFFELYYENFVCCML